MGYEAYRITEEAQTVEPESLLNNALEQIPTLQKPETPTQTLGNIALVYLMSGVMANGSIMPRTEAVAVEAIVGTVEYGENLRLAA